ncbi:hypothetical protein DL546_002512 [Coniochaeta pulveracea]|uniref:C2H2-type domain-containing protein n=1 Tax=Coniochaeta pulveracea TaxID=177199 RepID=A0A420XZA8_9PEZI|nr:hypothetical protein DL546_002512 [Coniochaeta pulveracea]
MSTVALQYSSTFDMAGRAPFSWPVMDSHNMLGHDLGSYSAATGVPPPGTGSRSVTGSPPRMFTAEQRELKRQQDQARRDSKISQRQRRTDSGSSYVSSPPLGMSEVTTGVPAMPIYSTASSQIPMLAEPAASATTHQYLSTYSSPIPMSNQFPNQYAAQPYMYTPDYQASSASAYPAVVGGSLPTQYGRTSMSDPSLLYQSAPPALPMGVPESQGNSNVRVVHSRPKPQCWEHGCNGRQFSTFSNLLRHQREKSGQATKATCPNCGAEFTRTTARNGHLLHDKCRGKRNSRSESVSGNKSE